MNDLRVRTGAVALLALAAAAPAAQAQGMWWVEGDRYCSGFGNRGSAMCGSPRKGETEPRPSFRYDFNFPRVPFIDDPQARREVVPAPADRPAAAPTRTQPRP
jgi:hypothetical protein